MIFTPRTTKPLPTGSLIEQECYFNASNNGYYPDYQMPNCTAYALGRALEIAKANNVDLNISGLGLPSAGSWGNAGRIGSNWEKGTTPKVGAICVYENGSEDGHVCVIEQVNEDGSYRTSNSAWYRPIDTNNWHYFYMSNHDKNNNSDMLGSSYTFKYFLYPPYIDGSDPSPYPPLPHPTFTKRKGYKWVLFNTKRRRA